MKQRTSRAYERLSIHDQSNLWAEAVDTPMHIMAVLQLEPEPFVGADGHLKLDEIRRRITRRMDQAPRLRQLVRPGSVLTGPPVWIDDVGFDLGRHVRERFVNLFITNVPGPPMPVDVLSSRLLDVIPVTPIAGNCTLGIGALSYNGCLAIAAVADADQVPDLDVVIQGMQGSWEALRSQRPVVEIAS